MQLQRTKHRMEVLQTEVKQEEMRQILGSNYDSDEDVTKPKRRGYQTIEEHN